MKMHPGPEVPAQAQCPSSGFEGSCYEWTSPEEQVAHTTAELCGWYFGASLRAVILTGSLARGEGSIVERGGLWDFASDAEFIVILNDSFVAPSALEISGLVQRIETGLAERRIQCHIALNCAYDKFLMQMEPHIFAYETKVNGRVVLGEPDILSKIPQFYPSEIPREDAWRLLSNRMIETAEALASASIDAAGRVPEAVQYRIIKLYLDMATSLLIFLGEYASSYRNRSSMLERLAAGEGTLPVPFPLRGFSEMVNVCTTAKLSPNAAGEAFTNWEDVGKALRFALQLWFWELQLITGDKQSMSPTELCLRAIRQEPALARLRGWAYVLRRQGWHKSARQWLRWMRLARRASPRYWLYAAIGEVYLRPQTLLMPTPEELPAPLDWQSLWDALPLVPQSAVPLTCDWRLLLRAIAWNYHEFLEETRG